MEVSPTILSQEETIMETSNIDDTTHLEINGEGEFVEEDLVEDVLEHYKRIFVLID